MTATITPPEGATGLARTDPNLRTRDYVDAVRFYLAELERGTFGRLLFADNSASHDRMGQIADVIDRSPARRQVELICYSGLNYPPNYGRAYGEFRMIDTLYETVSGLSEGNGFVWKVTGRYIVRNIADVVQRRPQSVELYCNVRSFPRRYADMYLLGWNHQGYTAVVRGLCERLRVDATLLPAEALFWNELAAVVSRAQVTRRFTTTPFITGVRGFNNREFNSGVDGVKYRLRVFLRWTAPWLWV